MPYTVFQSGSSLQFMKPSGALTTLTLPSNVTIDSTKQPRWAIFDRYIVLVNSPTRPLTIDADGVVRVLCPIPPGTPPTLAVGNTGGLTGDYNAKYSYVVFDGSRRLIAESPVSPAAAATAAMTSDMLRVSALATSADTISAMRLYRTTNGGSTYFPWFDLDGNTQTTAEDDLSDASLSLLSVPVLGAPPQLTHVGEFRDRLWGVSVTDIDTVRYTESSMMYSWPSTNALPIPRIGADDRGITGILSKKDQLGIARVNSIVQVTGNSNTNFSIVKLSQEVGVEADDSIAQYLDVIYFLWKDGVYTWDGQTIRSISDGKVRSWFAKGDTFNTSRLRYAIGRVDPLKAKYQLLLSAAGSSDLDRWIEYDIKDGTWWGPHRTSAFTPTWMGIVQDSNSVNIPVHASSNGFFWQEQDTRTDDTATGIALDVDSKYHDAQTPDITKFWDQPTLISKVQSAGTLTLTPYVGGLDATAGAPISADMTLGRERLRRLGVGRFARLNFAHSTAGQDIELFGMDIPFHEVGRR